MNRLLRNICTLIELSGGSLSKEECAGDICSLMLASGPLRPQLVFNNSFEVVKKKGAGEKGEKKNREREKERKKKKACQTCAIDHAIVYDSLSL